MASGVPFDRAAFRSGILTAMSVGLPEREADRPLFYFPAEVTSTVPVDSEDVPFDPTYTPTRSAPPPVRVDCAYEYQDREGRVMNFGVVTPSKVELTFLDAEYQQVKGFAYVVIGGVRYDYKRTAPPQGMVTETVWTVICEAEDED